MKKLAAFATTTVLLGIAGNLAASAHEAEPRDDHGTAVRTMHVRTVTAGAGDDHRHRHVERRDDHGSRVGPGDDRGNRVGPGDDHGNRVEPGDDHGNRVERGDDHGGHGGHGSDD